MNCGRCRIKWRFPCIITESISSQLDPESISHLNLLYLTKQIQGAGSAVEAQEKPFPTPPLTPITERICADFCILQQLLNKVLPKCYRFQKYHQGADSIEFFISCSNAIIWLGGI